MARRRCARITSTSHRARRPTTSATASVDLVDDDAEPQRARHAALPTRDVDGAQAALGAMLDDAELAAALRARHRGGATFDHRCGRNVERVLARAAGDELRELLAVAHELACV